MRQNVEERACIAKQLASNTTLSKVQQAVAILAQGSAARPLVLLRALVVPWRYHVGALLLPDADGDQGRVRGHGSGGRSASSRWHLMLHWESHFPGNFFHGGARTGANSLICDTMLFKVLRISMFLLLSMNGCPQLRGCGLCVGLSMSRVWPQRDDVVLGYVGVLRCGG